MCSDKGVHQEFYHAKFCNVFIYLVPNPTNTNKFKSYFAEHFSRTLPDIVVYIDTITIVFEEASKNGLPSSLPLACTEAGNDHSLPNLALRCLFILGIVMYSYLLVQLHLPRLIQFANTFRGWFVHL